MKKELGYQILLIAICTVTYLFNLGATHLWEEDEAYFGRTAREMSQRGDLVVPYFNGEISLHKPALMYWVMIAGTQLFGTNEFAFRIGSVLFSMGSVLLTYHLGRLLFSTRVGFWSGLVLATSLHFAIVARAAVADPELIFFCTLPILIFVAGIRQRSRVGAVEQAGLPIEAIQGSDLSWRGWGLAYASMALASLAKGPVGIVLPTAVIGLFLLMSRADAATISAGPASETKIWPVRFVTWLLRVFWPPTLIRTIWEMRPLTALAMITLFAAPWYVMVGFRTHGEWLQGFFFVHNVGRFVHSFESHSGGPLYYLLAICIGTWPWCMFNYQGIQQTIVGLRSGNSDRPAYLLLCAWIAVWVGAFTFAGTKLPHYVLPAYPAIAIIFGRFVEQWHSGAIQPHRGWMRAAWTTPILVGVGFLIFMPMIARKFIPGEELLSLIGLVPIVCGIVGLWADEQQRGWAAMTLPGMAVAFLIALLGWGAVRVDRFQKSVVVAAWLQEIEADRHADVGAFGCFEASLLYYCDRNIANLDQAGADNFFTTYPGEAYILTTDRCFSEIEKQLPDDVGVLRETPRFLKPEHLLLLGRKTGESN